MADRVSQAAVEVAERGVSIVRVSQAAIEVIEAPAAHVRLSAASVEAVVAPQSHSRVSNVAVEVIYFNKPPGPAFVRFSQQAIEALEGGTVSKARATQLAIEVPKQRPTNTTVGMSQLVTEVVIRMPIPTNVDLSQLVVEVLVPPAPFVHTRFWAQIL